MRPALHLVVVLVVAAAVVPALTLPATTAAAHPGVHLTGTVTHENGTAAGGVAVLVQPADATDFSELALSRSIQEGFRKLAASGGTDDVAVVRTDADGRYELTQPAGEYDLVAVTAERLSMVRSAGGTDGDTVETDLVLDPGRVQHVEGGDAGRVAPGNRSSVTVRVENADDDPMRNLTLSVALPAGIELVGVDTGGEWDADSGTLTWERVAPGEAATATLRFRVAADAEHGRYRVAYGAHSDTHLLQRTDPSRVTVRPTDASPTPTVHPGGDAATATPGGSTVPIPGFGPVVAAVAVLAAALLGSRRTD